MKHLLAVLAMMAFVGSVSSADRANFSGNWKINAAKSNYGPLPQPESFTRKIQHAEPTITIVEEQSGPGTTPTSTRTITTDGKVADAEINGAPVKLSATWEGAVLVATTALESFAVKFTDKMSLSADGKVLTSVVKLESGQGDVELTIVFDRQ